MKLATLAYVRRDGHTLMMKRNRKPGDIHAGKWNGLGGKFEPGESPEQCLVREVREESGLVVEEAQLKGFLSFPDFDGRDDWYAFVFVVTRFSGSLGPCSEGELHWIPDEGLNALEMWEGDLIFMPWLDEPGFFSATFAYRNGRLERHEVSFYRDSQPLHGSRSGRR